MARLSLDKVPDLTPKLKRLGGDLTLRKEQSAALLEAVVAGGLLLVAGVGAGKSLITLLLPQVLKAQRPIIVTPASARGQMISDMRRYARHFHLTKLPVVSYELISAPRRADLLNKVKPDLIIFDEADSLRHEDTTRGGRIGAFLDKHPRTKVCALTATLTKTSLTDFAHILKWVLKDKSPLPVDCSVWARVIDAGASPSEDDTATVQRELVDVWGGDSPRDALKRLLDAQPGVLILPGVQSEARLRVAWRDWKADEVVLRMVGAGADSPYGLVAPSTPDDLKHAHRQLMTGFGYVYKDPSSPKTVAWTEWATATRRMLAEQTARTVGHAKFLCSRRRAPSWAIEAWAKWAPFEKDGPPDKVAKWFSLTYVNDVIKWARSFREPPIIWATHRAVGIRIAKMTGWKYYSDRKGIKELLSLTHPTEPVILSLFSGGRGLNLQKAWGNCIYAGVVSDATMIEQSLGRIHRSGQPRYLVTAGFYKELLFEDALNKAKIAAEYVKELTGVAPKILKP